MRKFALIAGAAAVVALPAAPASAIVYNTPPIGRYGCGVESARITVAEPGNPTVTVDNVAVDVNFCLPPP